MNKTEDAINILREILPEGYVNKIEQELKTSLISAEEIAHKCITDIFRDYKEQPDHNNRLH